MIHNPSSSSSALPAAEEGEVSSSSNTNNNNTTEDNNQSNRDYLPPIPVMMRHPYIVVSVKQYRSESQNEQLQQHIVSESFIPMAPNLTKPPRKRRRPPFSYSSLIAQAILESENERMTLRDIYTWITSRYPALYNAEDTGWQNTIRHNLSLNRCFKKISKAEMDGVKGKGGYWTIDPTHMEKFKNGAFARGSSSLLRRRPTLSSLPNSPTQQASSQSSLPDTPVSTTAQSKMEHSHDSVITTASHSNHDYNYQSIAPAMSITRTAATAKSPSSSPQLPPSSPLPPIKYTPTPTKATAMSVTTTTTATKNKMAEPRPVMQIHNLLN